MDENGNAVRVKFGKLDHQHIAPEQASALLMRLRERFPWQFAEEFGRVMIGDDAVKVRTRRGSNGAG